jgi:hypothetical protein
MSRTAAERVRARVAGHVETSVAVRVADLLLAAVVADAA